MNITASVCKIGVDVTSTLNLLRVSFNFVLGNGLIAGNHEFGDIYLS